MKNKYIAGILLWSFVFFASCEKDDICIEETTPHLIIRFYDKTNPSQPKNVEKLLVAVKNSSNEAIEIGSITAVTDSIVLPLNVDINFTKISLSRNTTPTTGEIDDFVLNYNRNEVFVSRSCGYKVLFDEIEPTTLTTTWIDNISINNSTIENETAAHLSIFH